MEKIDFDELASTRQPIWVKLKNIEQPFFCSIYDLFYNNKTGEVCKVFLCKYTTDIDEKLYPSSENDIGEFDADEFEWARLALHH